MDESTNEAWLARLAEHDPELAEKARSDDLSHAEYVRAVGIAGPMP